MGKNDTGIDTKSNDVIGSSNDWNANDVGGNDVITESTDNGYNQPTETASAGSYTTGIASGDYPNDATAGIGDTRKKRGSGGRSDRSSATPNSASRTGKAQTKLDLTKSGQATLALQVKAAHEIVGLVTGFGDLCHITTEESETLCAAVLDVMAQYKIKPDPKVVAWCNLVGTMAAIYGVKAYLIIEYRKMKMEQMGIPQRQTQPPAPVDNIHQMKF